MGLALADLGDELALLVEQAACADVAQLRADEDGAVELTDEEVVLELLKDDDIEDEELEDDEAPSERRWPPPPPSALAAGVPPDLDRLCVDLLARGPELRPTGRELRRRLLPERRGAEAAPRIARREGRAAGGEVPFIGRTAQLGALRDALSAAEQGAVVTVLVRGGSGMGKSALLQRFLGEARGRAPGRLVLSGRCFEQESIPYKGVDGLVDDLCRQLRQRRAAEIAATPTDPMLARLFPQLAELAGLRAQARGDDAGDPLIRPRAFAALRGLLARASPHAPVLVVDDLQWSDLDSTALLAALLHGHERVPLLLVVAFRAEDAEASPVLRAFSTALDALSGRVEQREQAGQRRVVAE